jgi:hypothetical protein
MVVRSRRVACVLALAAGVTATADARPGKVVRVERRSAGAMPRVCTITITDPSAGSAGMLTYCFGPITNVGERIVAVSDEGNALVLQVEQVSAYTNQECLTPPTIWTVTPQIVDDSHASARSSRYYGLIDGGLDPIRSKVIQNLPPADGIQNPQETTIAFDRDGDGSPEFELDSYTCDDSGAPSSAASTSCWEMFSGSHGSLHHVRLDKWRNCP